MTAQEEQRGPRDQAPLTARGACHPPGKEAASVPCPGHPEAFHWGLPGVCTLVASPLCGPSVIIFFLSLPAEIALKSNETRWLPGQEPGASTRALHSEEPSAHLETHRSLYEVLPFTVQPRERVP